jgi:OPA family glycerol-3-phosphate transporter-like MFS transporter/OPA family sugar phosphate sensor protein UhpC-like MFS transporter
MLARVLSVFRPPRDIPPMVGTAREVRARYKYFRVRQLYTTFSGYAVYYFVRKNIPVALDALQVELDLNNAQTGAMLTVHDLAYGTAKFLNGFLGDRTNPRIIMPLGLVMSAIMNIAFGLSSGFMTLAVFWILNAWFQGMGFPPCARILSHWFSPKERGTFWGIWNTSHQVGAAIIFVASGFLVGRFGWRSCFIVPGVFAVLVAVWLFERLRDTPGSLGLPPVEVYKGEPATSNDRTVVDAPLSPVEFRRFVRRHVFGNKYIWFAAVANFFVYAVRYGFVNWAVKYLHSAKGVSLEYAGATMAAFEIAGLLGSLLAGWLTDRFLSSRRGPVCVAYMGLLSVMIVLFWQVPTTSVTANVFMLIAIGFLVYGPQFLVGVMVTDLATKQAAASAIGLTGLFGYGSGLLSGYGFGWILDHFGWDGAFASLAMCAIAGTLLFAATWNAQAETLHQPSSDDRAPASGRG